MAVSVGAAGKENIMGQDPNKMTVEELSAAAKEGHSIIIYAGVAEWEKKETVQKKTAPCK